MLLCYITDRSQFAGNEGTKRRRLLDKIAEAARWVDFIQLREKDLPARELETLAREAMSLVNRGRDGEGAAKVLINSRTDIALACGADGVHLRSDDIMPSEARAIWNLWDDGRVPVRRRSGQARLPTISVSCHSSAEVVRAEEEGADFAIYGPVFEKRGQADATPVGLEALRVACWHKIPVLAIGGVSLENVHACLQAGASGVAGIRLFQENEVAKVVASLRKLENSR
jgi:thiamine-phosphate pyrophosphorylase